MSSIFFILVSSKRVVRMQRPPQSYVNAAGKRKVRPTVLPWTAPHWDVGYEVVEELRKIFSAKDSSVMYRWPSDSPSDPKLDRFEMLVRAINLTYKKRKGRNAFYLDEFPNDPDLDLDEGVFHLGQIKDPVLYFLYNNMVIPRRSREWDRARSRHVAGLESALDRIHEKRRQNHKEADRIRQLQNRKDAKRTRSPRSSQSRSPQSRSPQSRSRSSRSRSPSQSSVHSASSEYPGGF